MAIVDSDLTSHGATSNAANVESVTCRPMSRASRLEIGSSVCDAAATGEMSLFFFLIRDTTGSGAIGLYVSEVDELSESLDDTDKRLLFAGRGEVIRLFKESSEASSCVFCSDCWSL